MYLSKKYLIPSLVGKCRKVIECTLFDPHIDEFAVFTILQQAAYLGEDSLREKCWDLVDNETRTFLCPGAFNDITFLTVSELLSRETLISSEIELFQAVFRWSGKQCLKSGIEATGENRRAILGDAIYNIRFLAMSKEDFSHHVLPSDLLTTDECIRILKRINGRSADGTLKWTKRDPRPRAGLLSFTRFDLLDREEGWTWSYNDKLDVLAFTVNKPIRFHGVQLFGDAKGSDFDVVFNIDGAPTVQGKFRSRLRGDGISTFNIFLAEPVHIEANQKIRIWAEIHGPESLFRMDGKQSVQCGDIVMTFFDLEANDPLLKEGNFCIGNTIWGPFYKMFVTPA